VTETPLAKAQRIASLSKFFTPSTPISKIDLFAGRLDQIVRVLTALSEAGRHVVLYGERGVGKTSLAGLLLNFHQAVHGEDGLSRSVRINCSTGETFGTIWKRIFRQLDIEIPETWTYKEAEPDEIRTILSGLTPPAVIILDEFDRWEDDEGLTRLADTVKSLSDHAVRTKIVIVGVADSIDELVGEHESIQRNLEQIALPRMSAHELQAIPENGFGRMGMTITDEALALIVNLSEGLPHYAHYLSLYSGQNTLQDDRSEVGSQDVVKAMKHAVSNHTVLSEYKKAIRAQRTGTLHDKVLLACALADKDELGFFSASDVRGPMSEIMGKDYDIPAFSPHLKAFTELDRGPVLRREGPERRFRYRFRNPLIQPFAIIDAISKGSLPKQYQDRLFLNPLPLATPTDEALERFLEGRKG
jgi:AAA domain